MKTELIIVAALLLASLAAFVIMAFVMDRPQRARHIRCHQSIAGRCLASLIRGYNGIRYRNEHCLANVAEGTHEGGRITFLAGAVITPRFAVVKRGADSNHVILSSSATDVPIGICTDEATAAEDPVNVTLFGAAGFTMKAVTAVALTMGDFIQSNGDGRVKVAVSTGYIIGRVVKDTAAGDVVEFDPISPSVALA